MSAMSTTKTLIALFVAGVAAASSGVGCAGTGEDVDTSEGAHTEKPQDDDDDFTVEDRMGRPEMTNVTMGAGLVRLKVVKTTFGALQAQVAAEADPTRKAALTAEMAKVGAELKQLATELGPPESEELKSALAKDAEIQAAEAKAIADAKAAGQPAPTFPRRPSGYFKAYNHQITFHPKPGERSDAMRLLAAGVRALDTLSLDGATPDPKDWSEDEVQKVAEILAEDALVVDLKGDCDHDSQSYFAIEREALQTPEEKAKNVRSCGGRTLNDDIIDDTLTMWVKKSFDFEAGNPRRVGDNVVAVKAAGAAGPYKLSPAIPSFPYLGEPRSTPFVGAGACSVKCRSSAPANASPASTPPASLAGGAEEE